MIQQRRVAIGLWALLLCVWGVRVSPGQEPSDPVINKLHEEVNHFLEGVSLGTTQTAYEDLLKGSQLLKQTKAVEVLVEKTSQIKSRYGEYRAFEQIAAQRVGNDLVLLQYLYKCENFPVVWYFTFYRTPGRGDIPQENDNWRVIIVRFDTELELLGL